ncbi:MAG: CBS domain-containing protein [Methanoregula sp.]|jgi:CBS domain-containing protein|uniref:CBS domain-containing protein n=1 Tax=Methanoregula sp. TaxID=2052170 RepID=UPI0025FF28D6|nr:CBS domain-containing protein [Methanoregula sp.]MCK9631717.1 CBS domain-containing protein [Methanoregula sp.]
MRTAQDFIVEIPVLKPDDQITRARQILRDDRFREVYVVDAKKTLLGYIDITDGLRVTATKSNVTIDGFVRDAPMISPHDSIENVARTMRQYHTDSAAVVDEKTHVVGGILLADLFPVIISRNELHGPVSRCMSGKVVSANPADELQKVYTLIIDSGFSAFPVVEKKRLVGIISRRDLISHKRVRSAIAQHSGAAIGDVMTRDVVTIAPDEPVRAAAELIVKHDVSLLPVTDGEHLVGVINRHDVLAALA